MRINNTQTQQMVVDRINDLRTVIQQTMTADNLSDSTRGTKLYGLRRDRKVLQLIEALVSQIPGDVDFINDDNYSTFLLLTRLQDEKGRAGKFYLNVGENIVQVMERYPNKRNLMKAITEYCDTNGLRLDTATMTIVEAE